MQATLANLDSYDYALALLDHATKTISPDLYAAYDVGCSFCQTVKNSALSDMVTSGRVKIMCDSLHAIGHDRKCQLQFNPRFIDGTGTEDSQQAERFFSYLNRLAGSIRGSSAFFRTQRINLCVRFNNEEADRNQGE